MAWATVENHKRTPPFTSSNFSILCYFSFFFLRVLEANIHSLHQKIWMFQTRYGKELLSSWRSQKEGPLLSHQYFHPNTFLVGISKLIASFMYLYSTAKLSLENSKPSHPFPILTHLPLVLSIPLFEAELQNRSLMWAK